MKTLVRIAIAFVLISTFNSYGQLLARTATITDSDSVVWKNGTCSIALYNSSGQTVYYNGTAIPTQYACAMNSSGLLSATLYTTSTLFPVSTQYTFSICSDTPASCSIFNSPVTTTDLSSTLSALVTAPRFRINPSAFNYGYSDLEIVSPGQDSTYWNSTTSTLRTYNPMTSSWTASSGGSGSVGATGTVQVAGTGGAFAAGHCLDSVSIYLCSVPIASTGSLPTSATNAAAISFGGGFAQYSSFGPDNNTAGGFQFWGYSANGSTVQHFLVCGANGGCAWQAGEVDFSFLKSSSLILTPLMQLTSSTAATCNASIAGTFQYTQGNSTTKDIVEVCAHDASNVYAWRTIY